jgi:hypothetical protein
LQSGTVTITFSPEYAHSEFQTISLTFVVTSNYTLSDKYWTNISPVNTFDSRVVAYNSLGYQFIGANNASILYLENLIQVLAVVGGSTADVTDKFIYNITPEDNADLIYSDSNLDGKIEFVDGGFRVRNSLGAETTLVVSAISTELGITFVFNINILPYNQIVATVPSHTGATKPTTAEADSTAVYAEEDIVINGYYYQQYNLINKAYENVTFPSLKYSIYKNGVLYAGPATAISGIDVPISLTNDEGYTIAILTFVESQLTKIVFEAVSEISKYELVVELSGATDNSYNLRKEIIFYVSPNIKVDRDSFENNETIDTNGIIYLNNGENPILNGDLIKLELNNAKTIATLTFAGTQDITLEFVRILGSGTFDIYNFEINEISTVTRSIEYTVSGALKLTEKTLTLHIKESCLLLNIMLLQR